MAADSERSGPAQDTAVDDMSWLLADDDPHVVAHGRLEPPSSRSAQAAREVPPATPGLVDVGLPVLPALPGATLSATPAAAPPASWSPSSRLSSQQPRHRAWAAVGSAFQPLPGGPLFLRAGEDRLAASVQVTARTPIHNVHAGTVRVLSGTDGSPGRAVAREDGVVVGYGGDVLVDWTGQDGDHLPAGALLGVVRGPGPESRNGRALLLVTVQHPERGLVDAVSWLSGLADPAELGMTAEDEDIGVDPFLLDLRLGGHLDDSAPMR